MFLIGVCCGAIPVLSLMMIELTRYRRLFNALVRDTVTTEGRIATLTLVIEADKALFAQEKSDLWGVIHTQNRRLIEAYRAIEEQQDVIRSQESLIREHNIPEPGPRPSVH